MDVRTGDGRGLFRAQEGLGVHGAAVPGPPWILGHRGAAREAPENTLAALRRAVELGLDGFAYDLRACASGELVLLADELLDRTTDAHGALALRTLPELFGIDAGAWFAKSFAGEPLALVEEALEIPGNQAGTWPQHVALLREPGLVHDLARALEGGRQLSVRVASPRASVCCEAQALGLQAMWMVPRATERELRVVREEGFAALATEPAGWWGTAAEEWPCERWATNVDEPDDLMAACRLPLNGFHTSEPRRALAARALARLAPDDAHDFPLRAPVLPMDHGTRLEGPGEWCGRWELAARVRNPFGFGVRVALELAVRRGAFEASGLPSAAVLAPGQEVEFPFRLAGGSWRIGGDPLLVAHYSWDPGPGRPGERFVLDAPLPRVRDLHVGESAVRIELVRERPGAPRATMTLRRSRRDLLVSIEDAGDVADAHIVLRLDRRVLRGGRGLRAPLPEDFGRRQGGVPFSVGIEGRHSRAGRGARGGELRRFAGGLPDAPDAGAPGRLHPAV